MTLYQAISRCKTEKDIEDLCLTHLEQVDNDDAQAIEYLYKLYMRNSAVRWVRPSTGLTQMPTLSY